MSTAATVTLLADVSGSVAVTDASHLTLDLGTYTLSWSGEWDQQNEDAICATGCANLTVTNGHINVSNYRNTGIRLDSCHDFLIKNVDVTCYDDDGDDRRCMVIDDASSGIIDGGTYISSDGEDSDYPERIPALYVGSDSVLTIKDGKCSANDGGSSDYVVYAKSVDVELPTIAAGVALPATAKATVVRADTGAAVETTAKLSWSTLDGAEVEAGSKALGNTPYVLQASIAPSKSPEVKFSSATTATFNGADALGVSIATDGNLEATYGFTTDAISISGASIAIPKASYAYTGKRVRPVPFVTLGEEQLSAGIDYTVSYSANKRVGTTAVTVTGTGQYAGTVSKGFKIVPAKVKGVTAKAAGKGKAKVSWAKHKAQTTGFEVRYGTSKAKVKAGKGVKTAKAKGAAKKAVTLKGLKSGKRVYVQVRAYKVVDGKTYYSAWSKVRSAKVK